jgi:peroxiredoxin
MKFRHVTGITLAGMLIAAQAVMALDLGDAMVDTEVRMMNIDDELVTLAGIKGEMGTLVIFSCNHCPVAKAWQTEMVAIGNDYQKKGFGVVLINSNDPAAFKGDDLDGMKKLAKAQGYEFPYVVDATSEVARHFGAAKTPDVFLFDKDAKLAYKGAVGEGGRTPKEGGEPFLKNALDALLAGTAVPQAETRSVGCSIKFR